MSANILTLAKLSRVLKFRNFPDFPIDGQSTGNDIIIEGNIIGTQSKGNGRYLWLLQKRPKECPYTTMQTRKKITNL